MPKYKHENNIYDHKKNKTNKPHKIFLSQSQGLALKSSSKHVGLQNLSIYYTLKNIRQCKNNKVKIIAPTWNNEFELPHGSYSMSDIQDKINKSLRFYTLLCPINPMISIGYWM